MDTLRMIRKLCIFALLSFAAAQAHATSPCIDSGSNVICGPAVYTAPATYSLCDDEAPATYRLVAWCVVTGGTWNSGTGTCDGATAVINPGSAAGLGQAFETQIHGAS